MSDTDDGELGPMQRAQRQMRPELPRRFYSNAQVVEAGGGFAVELDGRSVRTPGKRLLCLPARRLAEAIAAEWQEQGERIDPATMPMTRLANTVLDAVVDRMAEVRADALSFASTDMLCYRAGAPAGLVALQARHWDPILAWAERALGARLVTVVGIAHRAQPAASLDAIDRALATADPFVLAAIHELTTLSGSVVVALAVAGGALSAEAAWVAAHVEEDWQVGQWGEDEEAAERRKRRWAQFEAAANLICRGRA